MKYFNKNWIFSRDFSKNTQISNHKKIRPVGTELFHAGQWDCIETDMMKLTVAFCIFFKRSQKSQKKIVHNLSFSFIITAAWNELCINLQVITNNYYTEQRLFLFMNPPPHSVRNYYESKCTAMSLSSSSSLFFFPYAISSQQTNFAPAASAPQKKLLLPLPLSLALIPLRITCTSFGRSNL